jgi:hypothetical protein
MSLFYKCKYGSYHVIEGCITPEMHVIAYWDTAALFLLYELFGIP